MLNIILSIYILGCFSTIACMAFSHYVLGKTYDYWRIDVDLIEISTVIACSWLVTFYYIREFIRHRKDKPKDSCKKG